MKIYIVEGSSGMWDDAVDFVIGVYDSPQKADNAKQFFLAKRLEYRNRYTAEQNEKFDTETDEPEEMWSSEAKEWFWFRHEERRLLELNEDVKITECEINETLFKFD